jgi:hypothetical protein
MKLSVKIEKPVSSGELFWRELGRASFPQKQFTLGDRFFHLHLTLMQDTYNLSGYHCTCMSMTNFNYVTIFYRCVGKTFLVKAYIYNKYREEYNPTTV